LRSLQREIPSPFSVQRCAKTVPFRDEADRQDEMAAVLLNLPMTTAS
jgi:hypothetical protein